MSAIRISDAGIPIPDSTIARETTEFVQDAAARGCEHRRQWRRDELE
jgi:hypothetical protein